MKSNTYKLSDRDKLNLESIQKTLNYLIPTIEEADASIKSDGTYNRKFEISDSAEFGFCLEWLENFLRSSN